MLHIFKASAGSGKTYNLTRQYLKLLLGNHNPATGKWTLKKAPDNANRQILAITFTNKATEEMISRIISQLAILGGREPGKSSYMKEFVELFHTDEESIRALASKILDELLADYVFFNVSTIDSFFQNVLRIFAREIEMPDNFDLELENSYAIAIGVSEMFRAISSAPSFDPVIRNEQTWVRYWMEDYMSSKFEEGSQINLFSKSSSLYRDLVSTFNRLLDENFKIHNKEITDYLSDINRVVAFDKALKASFKKKQARLKQLAGVIAQYGDFDQLNKSIADAVRYALENDKLKERESTVPRVARNDQSKRFKVGYIRKGPSPDFDRLVVDFCDIYCQLYDDRRRDAYLRQAITPMGLLGVLIRHLDRYCKDNNLLILSETNTLLRDIINSDDTPFVYERLGYYLRNFLIDEFQDTSKLQWLNLRPLIMESLSHNHEDLIIGDEKQCIYRFRNSDPDLLGHEIARDVAGVYSPEMLTVEGARIEQNNNWRSAHEVVRFNNSIFHSMSKIIDDNETYSNVIQQISSARDVIPGHVKLYLLEKKDEESTPNEETAGIAEAVEDPELDIMSDEVLRLLKAGYRLSDICILVRTHFEGRKVISRLLANASQPEWLPYKVEVKSVDSVTVSDSAAVRMVIEILRLTQIPHIVKVKNRFTREEEEIENPAYKRVRLLYCYEYMRNQIYDFGGEKRCPTASEALEMAVGLMAKQLDPDNPEYQELPVQLRDVISFNPESVIENLQAKDSRQSPSVTLSSVIDRIIGKYILKSNLPDETLYLTALQDIVYDFCNRGNSDIQSFLDYWDKRASRMGIIASEDNSSISVMTIHQSKGLEFPCVIIPYANWDFVSYSSTMSSKKRTDWMSVDPVAFGDIPQEIIPRYLPMNFEKSLGQIPMFADQVKEIEQAQRIDNMNVAYVAFTRAVNELVVVSRETKKKNGDETFYTYLKSAVEKLTSEKLADPDFIAADSVDWIMPLGELVTNEDGVTVVEVGENTEPQSSDTKERKDDQTLFLPTYDPTINSRLATLTRLDSKIFDFERPNNRGDFFHAILRRVRNLDDLDLQIRRAVYRAHLSPEQVRITYDTLTKILDDERVKPWFEGYQRVVCERPLLRDGNIRRPDRIVWTADGHVDIIDYKFGAKDDGYFAQLRRYADMMWAAGYRNIRAFIWYVNLGEIVPVELDF